jgi:hypothetical protein
MDDQSPSISPCEQLLDRAAALGRGSIGDLDPELVHPGPLRDRRPARAAREPSPRLPPAESRSRTSSEARSHPRVRAAQWPGRARERVARRSGLRSGAADARSARSHSQGAQCAAARAAAGGARVRAARRAIPGLPTSILVPRSRKCATVTTRPRPTTKPLPTASGPLGGVAATSSTRVSGGWRSREGGHASALASTTTTQTAPMAARLTGPAPSCFAPPARARSAVPPPPGARPPARAASGAPLGPSRGGAG